MVVGAVLRSGAFASDLCGCMHNVGKHLIDTTMSPYHCSPVAGPAGPAGHRVHDLVSRLDWEPGKGCPFEVGGVGDIPYVCCFAGGCG